eukprot:g5842.t1
MSTQQQMNPKTSETPLNNKRKAPSQARLDKLKKLKENATKYVSKDLSTTEVVVSPKKDLVLDMPPEMVDMDLQVSMKKRRNGESLPHVHLKDDARKKTTMFTMPAMMKRFGNMTGEGNLGQFTKDPQKARFTVSLEHGRAPEWVGDVFKDSDPIKEQNDFMDKLKGLCTEMMSIAYYQEEDTSWDRHKTNKELEEFIEGANFSCIKNGTDKNGDDYSVVSGTRRLTDFQGGPNNHVFWKVDPNGKFNVIEPKYIRKDSFIICTGSLRAYNTPDMYGVSLDIGRDVIVLSMPKKDSPKKVTNKPTVPFINFDY